MFNVNSLTKDERRDLYFELQDEFYNKDSDSEDDEKIVKMEYKDYFLLNTGNAEKLQNVENLIAFYATVPFNFSILAVGNETTMTHRCIPNFDDIDEEYMHILLRCSTLVVEYGIFPTSARYRKSLTPDLKGNPPTMKDCEIMRKIIKEVKIVWTEHPDTKEVLKEISSKWDGEMNGILLKCHRTFVPMFLKVINFSLGEFKRRDKGETINITIDGKETIVTVLTFKDLDETINFTINGKETKI
uniref:Uncharacterized protein n=1 Tax=Pithovirus LCPAC403 TaxID=2506596 RepID=A0A481ZBS6_9VIRU|nr:MAG: hypothetical protein LCPAC403_00590 [Pithovirus LCPAC403]